MSLMKRELYWDLCLTAGPSEGCSLASVVSFLEEKSPPFLFSFLPGSPISQPLLRHNVWRPPNSWTTH